MAINLNLNLKQIKLTPEQAKNLGAGLFLAAVMAFGYYRYFWSPISLRIDKARAQIADMDAKIEKAKIQAGRLSRIQRELEAMKQQQADAEKRLPRDKDVPEVVDTVGLLARHMGVVLNSFTPSAPASKQYFNEIPYQLNVTGTYHDIGRFLAALALEERIYGVRNVAYVAAGASDRGGQPLTVTFTLIAFQYKG